MRTHRLRRATLDDISAIQCIVASALYLPKPDFIWHRSEVISAEVRAGRYWVFVQGGRVGGVLNLQVHEGLIWLEVIATVDEARGSGIGRMLVAHAAEISQAAGFSHLLVSTFHEYAIVPFYEHLGFVQYDRDDHCTWLALPLP